MNTGERKFAKSAISVAIRSALVLVALAPLAVSAQQSPDTQSDEVKALVYPLSYLDIGIINVPTDSPKYGEYNGYNESGQYLLGNFDFLGGDGYGMGSGTMRWQLTGTNLGTTSRNVGASVGDQGSWKIGVSYDQLRHYTTDGHYQTPFQGSQGDNVFILPPSFGVINTQTTTDSNRSIISANKGAQTLTPQQLAAYHGEDVYTERQNSGFNVGYHFNKQWDVSFKFNRLDQSGAKLIGSGTDSYDMRDVGGFRYRGERIAILMNPTEYKNDTFNLALNWVGKQSFLTAAYFASLFHDDYSGLSWSNPYVQGGTGDAPDPAPGTSPGAAFPISTMSTPPSNQLHQLSLTGGYLFSAATKLTGELSYARNTQNQSYAGTYTIDPNTVPVLPVGSLDGLVVNKHADVKLTHQATRELNLSAGFKYNERDNRTASNTYTFLDLGGDPQTVVNIPMSNKRYQFELAGDYRINNKQHLHLGYEYDDIKRWCSNALANNAQGELSSTNEGYYTVASCVQVPKNKENKLIARYRVRVNDKVHFNAGYTYSKRDATVNPSFYNPMQANDEGFENYGFLAYFDASRKQNLFKAGVSWDATSQFTIGLNGRYTRDNYDSTLGVQDGDSTSANLDLSYSVSEHNVISAYASWQRRTRTLLSAYGRDAVNLLDALWSNDLSDRDLALGLSGRQKALWNGKIELAEDLSYSRGTSRYDTTLVQNISPSLGADGSTPDISSKLTRFNITGTYHIDSHSSALRGLYLPAPALERLLLLRVPVRLRTDDGVADQPAGAELLGEHGVRRLSLQLQVGGQRRPGHYREPRTGMSGQRGDAPGTLSV